MKLSEMVAQQDHDAEARLRAAARKRTAEEFDSKVARLPVTPAQWFDVRFPGLADLYGDAVREEIDKAGVINVAGVNEDFLAATLSNAGSPTAPTVFLPTEQKFFTYDPNEGIYIHQRDPVLIARLSQLLLECARACKTPNCRTSALEFGLRQTNELRGVLKKAAGQMEVGPDFFKTDLSKYIAAANCMVRLDGNAARPFGPSYRRRNKLAVNFDPQAQCPTFLDVLMRSALEPDDLDLLQRWCGLALVGENLAQKMVILTGTAGGGKGCFVRVLTGVIGQANLASLRPQLLTERFEFGRYLGRTLLYGPDVPENFLNQRGASALKSLTGYDPMTIELKNSNEAPSIAGCFNVIVTCNSRLTVRLEGDTEAWRRRLIIIDYHKPKPEKVIADLDQQILRDEGPGVLNWMIEGLAKLRADGWQLKLTEAQQRAVDNLLLESDSHTLFVRNEIIKHDDAQLTVHDCYAAYAEYCNEHGWAAMNRNRFSQVVGDMITRQFGKTTRNDITDPHTGKAQRGWRGLKLKAQASLSDTLRFDDPERQAAWDSWEVTN